MAATLNIIEKCLSKKPNVLVVGNAKFKKIDGVDFIRLPNLPISAVLIFDGDKTRESMEYAHFNNVYSYQYKNETPEELSKILMELCSKTYEA